MNRYPFSLRLLRAVARRAGPCVRAYIKLRLLRGKEDPHRLPERFGYAAFARPTGVLVWCHAASVGEALSCLHLLKALRTQRPDLQVLLTTGTKTSARLVAEKAPEGVFHQYVPVDLPQTTARFLDHWRPDAALWLESELWPQMLMGVAERHIPMVLINGRISERSCRRWKRHAHMIRALLGGFTHIFAGSAADAERFSQLGATDVQWQGNIKYDAPALAAETSTLSGLSSLFGQRTVWCAASTHEGEDELIAQAHLLIAEQIPDLLTILVPRHPARGAAIARMLEARGLSVAQRSLGLGPAARTQIFLADTIGELGNLYRLCEVVFVGGSLVPHGGHNIIEPARLNCGVITGGSMHNFREIYQDFVLADAVRTVHTAHELADAVSHLLLHEDERTAAVQRAAAVVSQQAGATRHIVKSILPLLPDAEASERVEVATTAQATTGTAHATAERARVLA